MKFFYLAQEKTYDLELLKKCQHGAKHSLAPYGQ